MLAPRFVWRGINEIKILFGMPILKLLTTLTFNIFIDTSDCNILPVALSICINRIMKRYALYISKRANRI